MTSVNQNFNNQDESARNGEFEKENRLLKKRINQLELVHGIGRQISLTLELDSVLTQIVRAAVGVTNAEIAALMLIDEHSNNLHLRAHKTSKETYVSTVNIIIKDKLANEAIQQKKPLRLTSEERILTVVTGYIVRAVLYVPIQVDGKVLGVLSIQNETRDRVFSGEDEQFLANLAEYAGIAIRNSEWLKKEQNLRLHTEVLRKAAIKISVASSLEQLGEMLLDTLAQVVEYKKATVQIITGLNVNRRLIAIRGFSKNEIDLFLLRPVSQDRLAQRVFEEKKPLILADPTSDPDWDSERTQTSDVKSWIGLPLVHNQPLGLITLDHNQPGYYTEVLSDLLGVFCSQTAAVIENLNLLKSEQEQKVLSKALSDTAIALNTALDLDEVLEIILKKVEQVVPHESANIMLIEHGIAKVTRTNGYPKIEGSDIENLQVKVSEYSTFAMMCQTRDPLLISNVKEYPGWIDIPGMPSVKSYLGAPICIADQIIGFLNLQSNSLGFFSIAHTKRIQAFTDHIAVAIKKSQLLESSLQQATHLEIVNETLRILSNKLNVDDLLQSVVDQVATKLNCTHCTLFQYNQETGKLEPTVVSGRAVGRSFDPGEGIVGWVFQSGESVISDDATKDSRFAPASVNLSEPRSMIISPVKMGEHTIGVICADQDEYGWFNDAGRKLVEMLGQQSGIAIERAKGLDLLHRITNEMVSLVERNDVLKHIVSGAIKLTNASAGVVYLLEVNELEEKYDLVASFKYPTNFVHPAPRLENKNGLTRTVISEHKCIVIPDIPNPPSSHPNLSINPDLKEHYSSMLGMPLMYAGNVIGVLFVHDESVHEFSEIQISLLSTLAQLAAIAIRNAQLYIEVQANNRMLGLLQQASNMLIGDQEKNIREILQDFLMETCQATNARYLAIVLINNQGQIEDIVRSPTETPPDNIQPRLNGYSIQIWRTRESQIIPDTGKFWGDIPLHPLIDSFNVRSVLGIPWIANNDVIGVVWLYYDDPRDFSVIEEKSIRTHFDQAAFIYQNSIRVKEQYVQRESMFSTLAHELKTPLVSVASTANALKEEVSKLGNKRAIEMASKLIEQSKKLELQNETILAMFGRQNKPVSFKLNSIYLPIIRACELFESTALQKGCEIKSPKALNGHFPSIEMSAHHLILAFQNLVSNAIKYSYSVKAGVDAERYITISGDWNDIDQSMYTIRIQNYGVGIDPDEISSKRIFRPFERGRLSGDRGRPGKGLGLALVWHVVTVMHNGSIDVESRNVAGGASLTTFFLTLPVKQGKNKILTNAAQ